MTADSMIDQATGRAFVLRKHGLSVHEVRNVRPGARFVLGFIPHTTEITGHARALREALSHLSVAGDHFTYFASEYRAAADTVVLLDYIRGSAVTVESPSGSRELQDR